MAHVDKEIERQYSPAVWSKRFQGVNLEVVEQHIQIVGEESDKVKQSVPNKKNIRYGKRDGQFLDIYGGELQPGDKILVYIHGGYWTILDKDQCANSVKPLYDAGIKVIVTNYDLAPKVNMETIVCEIKEMAEFVLTLAEKSQCSGVWLVGHSAGAHLAAECILDKNIKNIDETKRNLLKGLILISGLYDLGPLIHTTKNEPLQLKRQDIEKYSPLLQKNELNIASRMNLNVLVAVGEYESPAFQSQSEDFAKYLEDNGIKGQYWKVIGECHFTIVEKLNNVDYELTKRIIHLLKMDN